MKNKCGSLVLALLVTGCGASEDDSDGSGSPPPLDYSAISAEVRLLPDPSAPEASRFLQRATYGPTESEIAGLDRSGYATWLAEQFGKPTASHVAFLDQERPKYLALMSDVGNNQALESFWRQTAIAPDALRQRVSFALLDFFVVSFQNSALNDNPYAMSSFHDMLARNAFGNFRQLLEDVTLHPAMGIYLSHLGNQKETTRTVNGQQVTQLPDENYARELMQLFSIGLWELNSDGAQALDSSGNPVPTYGQEEIFGMAKVLTGFSWGHCANSEDRCFRGGRNGTIDDPHQRRWRTPMQAFERFHSTSDKRIVTGRVLSGGNAHSDLTDALDTLFHHPNVGPFFGRQMIQRLVTSNPSRAYVQRVTNVFNDNGKGVRGDMKAVVQAVLLDAEARDLGKLNDPAFGKLREPVVKYGHLLRTFSARAPSGYFRLGNLLDALAGIGQSPYLSPSVFNFFRPDYAPPGAVLQNGLQAPEFQITQEATVTSNARAFDTLVRRIRDDTRPDSIALNYTAFMADAAANPARLLDRLDLLLTAGTLSPGARTALLNMLTSMPSGTEAQQRDRVRQAIWVIVMSPDFMIQK
jgi:uncharacterized protein (DUF1800 family)